ncbi:MAG: stage II sporulation protein D [Clostridia bacterium]|nr:stage II sporulation protein D [Clostridia bacterium]
MKFYALICILTAISLILTPAIVLLRPNEAQPTAAQTAPEEEKTVTVFLSANESTVTMPLEEYVVGAVAAEMPASSHPQALMAQAVACRTFALYRQRMEKAAPTSSLRGADLSDQPQRHQGYLSEDARREKWGEDFKENEAKVRDAVRQTNNEIMTYNGEPIFAAFFAVSSGQTESAETVFGDDLPYLKSVVCDEDLLSPDCTRAVVYTAEEFRASAQTIDGVTLPDDEEDWISETDASDSGFVRQITLGETQVTGMRFRDAFSLRSAVFTVSRTESGFRITTKGFGHLVGMSQYAADTMARSGADHKQILRRFYTDVKITDE